MRETLSYDDVLLVPQYSAVESRTSVELGNYLDENLYLPLPIIASPMDTISEKEMAIAMARAGGLAIIHRYNTIEQQETMIAAAASALSTEDRERIGVAIGITGDYVQRARRLLDAGASVICVDVAHGHHIRTERAIKTLRDTYGDLFHLMAGNVATVEGFEALSRWGADSVRVGIGGGSICSTRLQTGHGIPTFTSLRDCAHSYGAAAIIADGGIKNSGDIVKALAAGADFVMIGSLLAGTTQTPGLLVETEHGPFKSYRGMASRDAQVDWRGKSSAPEGIATTVPFRGEVGEVLADLRGGLSSGFSYSGAASIDELWANAQFVKQTSGGRLESQTHILYR